MFIVCPDEIEQRPKQAFSHIRELMSNGCVHEDQHCMQRHAFVDEKQVRFGQALRPTTQIELEMLQRQRAICQGHDVLEERGVVHQMHTFQELQL